MAREGTKAAQEKPATKTGKTYRGTYQDIVERFLSRVTGDTDATGHVVIRYKHARLAAAPAAWERSGCCWLWLKHA